MSSTTLRLPGKSTRIPKFGTSRIPLPGSTVPLSTRIATKPPSSQLTEAVNDESINTVPITKADIGKHVHISKNSAGILRFVGEVEFAAGTWAGVQLSGSGGKHDGCINGYRYFTCPPGHGLLVPLSKITLIDSPADSDCSGPYSMIFGLDEDIDTSVPNISITATPIFNSTQKIVRSRTFDKIEISPERNECSYTKGNTTLVKTEDSLVIPESTFTVNKLNNTTVNAVINNDTITILDDLPKGSTTFNKSGSYQPNVLNTRAVVNIPTPPSSLPNNFNTSATVLDKQYMDTTFTREGNTSFNAGAIEDHDRGKETTLQSKAEIDKTYDLSETICNPKRIGKASLATKRRTFVLDLPNNYSEIKLPHTSTPGLEEVVLRKCRPSPSHLDDDSNKRDSLEFEESLGILTPDQMVDVTGLAASRTPSSENIRLLPHDNESSAVGEYSLGLIDLSNVTMNLQLVSLARLEQTPSPEELPLDPTPLQEPKDKKPPNSFITSITSITSLDTGYQGDGEMSRPASRGADNSPLTRRPQPRPTPRRTDPMTDSDFYTESDADNHDDNPLKGDRKAQVIDGTLYGIDAQATADLYANNRENMDSSGIFTDLERTEDISSADNDVLETKRVNRMEVELSPSDSSTQTISDDSQTNVNAIIDKTLTPPINRTITPPQTDPEVVSNASTITSTPNSVRSTRPARLDDVKHKTPKRNIQSKLKSSIAPCNKENEKRIIPKKTGPGRWDAVMNRISAPETRKGFKEVKSKVFSSLNTNTSREIEKKPEIVKPTLNNRRIRSRVITSPKQTGSISSSLSDLSGASRSTKAPGSAKKREALKVNQVLNGSKNQTKNEGRNNNKNLLASKESKEKKKDILKNTGRSTPKGNLVTTNVNRPQLQQQQRTVVNELSTPQTAEALAVLVQHLVFNLEAFKNPYLQKEAKKAKLDAEKVRVTCKLLEESLEQQKQRHMRHIEEEQNVFRSQIAHLTEKHRNEIIESNTKNQENLCRYEFENCKIKNNLILQYEDKLRNIKVEFEKLQKTHSESLNILSEENDAIREEIDEKNDKIRRLELFKHESDKLRLDYEAKEIKLQEAHEEIARLREEREAWFAQQSAGNTSFQEVQSLRAVLDLKQGEVADLRKLLAETSHKADQLPAAEEKVAVLTAKCEDLQHQLERKNESELCLFNENKKLNESIKEESNQRQRLRQHNEELQWRLQQNKEVFKVLEGADQAAFTRSLTGSSFNERHNGTSKHPNFERTLSFRERKMSTVSAMSNTSRKSKCSVDANFEDISPPSSPKVKGVVEKSDSVSYVLEMDESPETVASRIVRRSFRNATPPKNTPTKSPANKRPRKSSLMQSASASCIPMNKDEVCDLRSTAARTVARDEFDWGPVVSSSPYSKHRFDDKQYCVRDYEEEDMLDLRLPELPSEIGCKHGNRLPVPKHMAGEVMISESNSEDESSSSSSSGHL